jgi:hypothetical protein
MRQHGAGNIQHSTPNVEGKPLKSGKVIGLKKAQKAKN